MPIALVTGGSGFIGGHIVEMLCKQKLSGEKDWKIRVLDDMSTGNLANIQEWIDLGLVKFIKGSILDAEVLDEAVAGVDYVFHLAAAISVAESMSNPSKYVDINVNGTLQVLAACERAGTVKKVVLSSSAAVYGENNELFQVETLPYGGVSPYALSKFDGEEYCKLYSDLGKVKTVSLRYFNVFGPRQNPNSAYAAAIPKFVQRALANEDLTVFGDGEQTRDFVFVHDIASANIFVATHPEATGVFNVGYGSQTTINHLASIIVEQLGSRSRIVHTEPRPGDIRFSVSSPDKIMALGWRPSHSLESGLALTLNAYKDNNSNNVAAGAATAGAGSADGARASDSAPGHSKSSSGERTHSRAVGTSIEL